MSNTEKNNEYNPSGVGIEGKIFGLPFNFESSKVVLLPVPWDVTVSYGYGTHEAPERILQASYQVDLYDFDNPDAWQSGIYMLDISEEILASSHSNRVKAGEIIRYQEKGGDIESNPKLFQHIQEVNEASAALNKWVCEQCTALLNRGKIVGLLGGDHSTPMGYLTALAAKYENFGILQIDAHADLRNAYEGFTYSHASIMYNALEEIKNISKLVQVGIRDICHEEIEYINKSNGRIETFFDPYLKEQAYLGKHWNSLCEQIIKHLPTHVYISYDIDGLDPKLCPGTGTPVAGGFEVEMINYLIGKVKESGRKIIGFDLVEVGTSEWDANVGARVLYKLCNLTSIE